jgi:polyvinyl alcohol dehydrogenase (cytochrome)
MKPKVERRRGCFLCFVLGGWLATSFSLAFGQTGNTWPSWGYDTSNTRNAAQESIITKANVGSLKVKWVFTTAGDVSATPTVDSQAIYFPDWGGYIYKVDKDTGSLIWKHKVSDYTGIIQPPPDGYVNASLSRNGPALAQHLVIFGDQASANVMAVDKTTGNLIWKTLVEPHPLAMITSSPVVYNNVVYLGVSSSEEFLAGFPGYTATFRGSVVALDVNTGHVLWQTYTVPPNSGTPPYYTGGSVWGSTPAVDPNRNSVYVATGNNYTVPTSAANCVLGGGGISCLDPADYFDSVLALDLNTGAIKWSQRVWGPDFFNLNCAVFCDDFDFGSGPNLFRAKTAEGPQDLVGAGQKSGIYWAFNPDTGSILWNTSVGPGSIAGGTEWGSATDGKRIYVAISNWNNVPYPGNPRLGNGGSWAALDAATGTILWQVPTPQNAMGLGAMTVADQVVFAPSMSGDMVALDSATGVTLWSYHANGSVVAAPAIVNGVVYWGTGYSNLGLGTGNNQLFAFSTK